MKQFWFIIFAVLLSLTASAQIISEENVSDMVALIDEHLDLNEYQKKEVSSILSGSLKNFNTIQQSKKTDIEKLNLLQLNQKNTREKLQVVLEEDQMGAYEALLDGESSITIENNPSPTSTQPIASPKPYINSENSNTDADAIAQSLNFTGDDKASFVSAYKNQEAVIEKIASSGNISTSSAIELLTTILVTDFKIIDLGGQDTYEKYFQLRQNGAFSKDGSTTGQDVDISQVYQLYNLKTNLELTDNQAGDFISLILKSEVEKKEIRKNYQGSERTRRMKALEQEGLTEIQKLLSPAQIQKLSQILGG